MSVIFVYVSQILDILSLAFEAMAKLYEKVGFGGLIEVRFSLSALLGVKFMPVVPRNYYISFPDDIKKNETDSSLSWDFTTSVAELNDIGFRQGKLLELGETISWSMGHRTDRSIIEKWFRENRQWIDVK